MSDKNVYEIMELLKDQVGRNMDMNYTSSSTEYFKEGRKELTATINFRHQAPIKFVAEVFRHLSACIRHADEEVQISMTYTDQVLVLRVEMYSTTPAIAPLNEDKEQA